MSIVLILRVISMEGEFRSLHESTWHSSLSTISLIRALFYPKFWYVIAETMGYKNGVLCFFNQMLGSCRNFQLKVEIAHFLELCRISFIRWSVNDRSPIDFVRIFFLYSLFLYSLLGGLSTTDHLLISLEFSFFILSLFFIFISSVHFFVHTFTRNQHGQLPSNFCQSSSPMISSQINFFKVTRSSWRHPGAIL